MRHEDMEGMKAEGKEEPGGISKIVEQVGAGLSQLADAFDGSDATTDQDRAALADIMSKFSALVEKQMSAAPGEDPEAEDDPSTSVVSAMGGAKGVPMGPQGMARS